MISKTKIKNRTKHKTNYELIETTRNANKNKAWLKVAQILSAPTRDYSSVNLEKVDKETKAGDTVVVPGKVLGSGELTKKVRICALSFSSSALIKMKSTKSEAVSINDEIKLNPKAEGVKIIR